MVSGPETAIVEAIRKAVKREWPTAYMLKTHGSRYMPVGTPDLLMCVEGRFVALEVKHQKPGESAAHAHEKATPAQVENLVAVIAAGGIAAVVLGPGEAIRVIQDGLAHPAD